MYAMIGFCFSIKKPFFGRNEYRGFVLCMLKRIVFKDKQSSVGIEMLGRGVSRES